MSYIRRSDFAIFKEVPKEDVGDNKKFDFFECDELAAPAVSELNKKGYKTGKCSSGHVGLCVEGECLVSNDNEMPDDELKEFFSDTMCYHGTIDIHKAKKNRRKVLLVSETDPVARIGFSAGVPDTIPEGWYKEGRAIKYRFDNTSGYDFFKERLDAMYALHQWALALPEKEMVE